MSFEKTIEYLQNVETSLKNGERAPKLKNLLLPMTVLIPMHIDKLEEGGYLAAFQESIKEYQVIYNDSNGSDEGEEEHNQDKSDVQKAMVEIVNMKASASAVCTGPDKTMVPHKADPTIFEDYGLCSDCVMKHGEYKGAKPKKKKKVKKDDILFENISKCIEDVLDEGDKQILQKTIKADKAISGEQIYQKLKSVAMSKTPGNWTKLVDKIKRDVDKLHSAYGVQAVVYVHNKRVQKLEKIGKARSKCKVAGKSTQEDGQVINTFEVAENHLTDVLMSLEIEDMPSQFEAYLAAKVMNSLSQVGLAKLKDKKEEDRFVNTDEFLAKFRTWMDNLEKGGDEKDQDESDDDEGKSNDVNDVLDGFHENNEEDNRYEEDGPKIEIAKRPQKRMKLTEERNLAEDCFVRDELYNSVADNLNAVVNPSGMDVHQEYNTPHGHSSQESLQLFNFPTTLARPPVVLEKLSVQPQFEYVSDTNVSLIDSFSNLKK